MLRLPGDLYERDTLNQGRIMAPRLDAWILALPVCGGDHKPTIAGGGGEARTKTERQLAVALTMVG